MKFIGIGYKARHGKDSLAEWLQKNLQYSIILHFADALYDECRSLLFRAICDNSDAFVDVFKGHLIHRESNPEMYAHILSKGVNKGNACIYSMTKKDPILLQWWGTEVCRKQDPDYWVGKLDAKIKELAQKNKTYKHVIIPDMRFRNEVDYVREQSGVLVRVTRLNLDGTPFVAEDRDPFHPSETELDSFFDWDYEVEAESGNMDVIYSLGQKIIDDLIVHQVKNFDGE